MAGPGGGPQIETNPVENYERQILPFQVQGYLKIIIAECFLFANQVQSELDESIWVQITYRLKTQM